MRSINFHFLLEPSGKQQRLDNYFAVKEVPTPKTTVEAKQVDGVLVPNLTRENSASTAPESSLSRLLTEKSWKTLLRGEFEKPYVREIEEFLKKADDAKKIIYPPRHLIFNAFNLTPVHELKVVIIGQDPYHGVGQVRV